jgi:D-alanyl-D-alanine dipeptidase
MFIKKYFWYLSIFLLILTGSLILNIPSASAISCKCNGPINGYLVTQTYSTKDHQTVVGLVNNSCVRETSDETFDDTDDCALYIQKNIDRYFDKNATTTPSNYNAYHFDGTCEISPNCGSGYDVATSTFQIRKPVLNILIPNLNFSDINTTTDQNGDIQIPWIGEYIVAVYQLLVNVASILGVILIIREGIRIILSAGGESKMEGYHNIGRILIGLILAWFSYVILYNLNSSLVSIKPLNVKVVVNKIPADDTSEEDDSPDDATTAAAIQDNNQNALQGSAKIEPQTPCPWKKGQFDPKLCYEWKATSRGSVTYNGQKVSNCGAAPQGQMVTIRSCFNPETSSTEPIYISTESSNDGTPSPTPPIAIVTIQPRMVAPLCKAILLARKYNYDIRIGSSYRSFPEQMNNYCKSVLATGSPPASTAIASPGGSNHGQGLAVDAYLYDKQGNRLTFAGTKKPKKGNYQCNSEDANIDKIARFFYEADSGFNRLGSEIWHFEYGLGKGGGISSKTYTLDRKTYCK